MTANTPTQPAGRTTPPEPAGAAESSSGADSADAFQAALEAEVARRIDAVERRWQSRKDRELNRARRRWESEAGQAIDPELLTWIAQADPREVGQWLKARLTEGRAPEQPASNAGQDSQPAPDAAETSDAPAEHDQSQPDAPQLKAELQPAVNAPAAVAEVAESQAESLDSDPAPDATRTGQSDAAAAEDSPPEPALEREAEARARLAERRSQDPSPDLFPSRGAPADAFHQVEAGFARGEVNLDTYETARRRRGLT